MAKYRKLIAALITGVVSVLAVILTAEQFSMAQVLIAGVVSLLGAAGVYAVKNEEPR